MNRCRVIAITFIISIITSISQASDVQQKEAVIGLNVPQVIELTGVDMEETIVPGPEDYARNLDIWRIVNDPGGGWRDIIAVEYNDGTDTHTLNLPLAQTSPWKNSVPQGSTTFSSIFNALGVSGDVTHEQLLRLKNDVAPTNPGTWTFHLARVEETFIRTASDNTGNEAARDNAMYDDNNDIGRGFAERTKALSMTIFTNAQD